jgi:ribonuclease HI
VKRLTLFVDGAARGNPGPAGIGVVVQEGDTLLKEIGDPLGIATNNVAEYTALIRALEAARDLGADAVSVFTDSELMERQLRGIYRVRTPHLLPLYQRALELLRGFRETSVKHIPREKNRHADYLSNLGADRVEGRKTARRDPRRSPGSKVEEP